MQIYHKRLGRVSERGRVTIVQVLLQIALNLAFLIRVYQTTKTGSVHSNSSMRMQGLCRDIGIYRAVQEYVQGYIGRCFGREFEVSL